MRNSCLYTNRPKTFRRSSTALMKEKGKKLSGWGSNLQNIAEDLREIYHPDGFSEELYDKCKYWLQTGDTSVFTEEELLRLRVFVQRDQAGAEALIVAYECEKGKYRALFENGIKVHVYVAIHLFPDVWYKELKDNGYSVGADFDINEFLMLEIKNLKQHKYWKDLEHCIKKSDGWGGGRRYYYYAKQTCHSANYGIEANTFIMNILEKSGGKVVIPRDEGERFLRVYRELFPEIPERNSRIKQQVESGKILYNIQGFPYIVTSYNITESDFKEYYAWTAQSSVAEITRVAYTKMQQCIEEYKKPWDQLADTHDSYLHQCPLLDVKECAAKSKEFMNQRLVSPLDGTEFFMQSEANVGFNWSKKRDDNLLGLQELKW